MKSSLGRRLATVAGSVLLVLAAGLPAAAADSSTTWYLALGDSLAAGRGLGPGDLTPGYAGPVLAAQRETAPKTRLRNLGCHSGETSTSMLTGNPACTYDQGSQFRQALVFLRAHDDDTTLVTLSVGANDVTPCLGRSTQPEIAACVQQRLGTLAGNLVTMLRQVREAAPQARVVVANYYNPYVVHPQLGGLSTQFQLALNEQVIRPVATTYGARVADLAGAFHSHAQQAASYVCTHTYMCSHGDIHPRPSGYDLISQAFRGELG